MKKYEIEINNEIYHVTVKELPSDTNMTMPEETSDTPDSTQDSEPVMAAEGTEIKAPMSGTILRVDVAAGDEVAQGDVLVVLEAMKMENEIVAPIDGTVGEIFVNTNDRVESDQVLLTL